MQKCLDGLDAPITLDKSSIYFGVKCIILFVKFVKITP